MPEYFALCPGPRRRIPWEGTQDETREKSLVKNLESVCQSREEDFKQTSGPRKKKRRYLLEDRRMGTW